MSERHTPSALFATGHYGAALRALRELESRRPLSLDEQVLLAETLSAISAADQALAVARQLIKPRGLSAAQRCRVRGVMGESLFRKGQTGQATDQYLAGIELAETHHELFEECRLRVDLFRCQINWLGPYQAATDVTTLRRKTYHLADPSITVMLQLALAALAAKLALLPRAHKHLETAKTLLPTVTNIGIHTEVKVVEVVLAAYEANYGEALRRARELAVLVEETGVSDVVLRGNLGHLLVMQARFDEALEWLNRGIMDRIEGRSVKVPLTLTLMQLRLAQGAFDEAGAVAQAIDQMLERSEGTDSYYGLEYQLSRVKWLYGTGKAAAGLATALAAIPRLEQMADQNLLYRMKLLAAEGLGRTGRTREGAALMADTVNHHPDPSPETIAEALRVSARLTADRDAAAAMDRFDRAIRILEGLGSHAAILEIQRDVTETVGVVVPERPVSDRSGMAARRTLTDQLSTLVALGSHPGLLASESLNLLAETGVVLEACIIETQSDGQTRTVATFSGNGAASRREPPQTVRLDFGDHHHQRYEIHASLTPDAEARAAVLAIERLVDTARSMARARQLEREQAALWPDSAPEQQLGLICISEQMRDLVKTVRRVAGSNVPVLITGETGVGKELFARALHQASLRRQQVFIPFNCSTLPREMLDRQLLAAAGGTLFLDEIGEMSSDAQPTLLRFLESAEILPLGERSPLMVDVRMVAATNTNLEELVAQGRFREDLFYRLNVIRIHVPPLRERREEVPALVQHFLERYARELQKPMLRVADATLEYLVLYGWPGNVRQLANEVRRMVALAEPGAVLMPEHLSAEIAASRRTIAVDRALAVTEVVTRIDQPLAASLEHVERAAIQRALAACEGHVDEAAKLLGLSRKGLYLKRQRLGLE